MKKLGMSESIRSHETPRIKNHDRTNNLVPSASFRYFLKIALGTRLRNEETKHQTSEHDPNLKKELYSIRTLYFTILYLKFLIVSVELGYPD